MQLQIEDLYPRSYGRAKKKKLTDVNFKFFLSGGMGMVYELYVRVLRQVVRRVTRKE